jgi:DNA-binding transcriptional LysR family regulator
MSQPGLSRLLLSVESELGVRLFRRGRAGSRSTDAGKQVLRFALDTITAYDELMDNLGCKPRLTGTVRVIASTTPGEYLAPSLVAEFNILHPAIAVETRVTDSAAVPSEVLSGRSDLGFAGTRSCNTRLRHVPIARDEVVLAVPASHPLSESGEISIADLDGQRMLHREQGSGTYETVRQALTAAGLSLPDQLPAMTLGSTQAVVSAVDAGLGVGFVTLRALEAHRPSRVAAVRISGVPIVRDLYLVYEPSRMRPRHVQAFLDYVEQKTVAGDNGTGSG